MSERDELARRTGDGMERVQEAAGLVVAGTGSGAAVETEEMGEALAAEVALLDELAAEWKRRALSGDAAAVDLVLAIQRQRAQLTQTWPTSGVRVSAEPGARGDEREVRVVIEYVNDWRQAGRRKSE